jgi:hypothetical protein
MDLHRSRDKAFFESDERAKARLKGWEPDNNYDIWTKVDGNETLSARYSIFRGPSVRKWRGTGCSRTSLWKTGIGLLFCYAHTLTWLESLNSRRRVCTPSWLSGSFSEKPNFQRVLRGTVLSHTSECNTTTLCPVCSSHSPPRRSRIFHCSNQRCGYTPSSEMASPLTLSTA